MAKHDPAPSLQRLQNLQGSKIARARGGGTSLLMEEFSGNQIEHKLFGFLANQFLSHFVKFKIDIVKYYLSSRRCFSHRGLSKCTCMFISIKPYLEAALPAESFVFR